MGLLNGDRAGGVAHARRAVPTPVLMETPAACVQETKAIFEKLYKFIGKNIKSLIDRPNEPYCFRLHKNKVYYVKEKLMKKATNVSVRGGHKGETEGCMFEGMGCLLGCLRSGAPPN